MLKTKKIKAFFIEIGAIAYFANRFFKQLFSKPFEFKALLKQCYKFLHNCDNNHCFINTNRCIFYPRRRL